MSVCKPVLLASLLFSSLAAEGADWYVAPAGASANSGTKESPWDIASALNGRKEVRPGDTICLLEGTYRRRPNELFEVRAAGTAEAPIHVRPAAGARARIDGGLAVLSPSANLWVRDLEIFISEPVPEKPVSAGSSPRDLQRPNGGLHMHGGKDCKYINLSIHNCNQAISCWVGEINPEIYGCILYGNGWLGVDRGHGHCIYTQNDEGIKTISNCIMTCRYDGSYTMHAYGSERAYVNNFLATENICYAPGPFLIGGGRPSHGIRVQRNFLYGIDMRIGYGAPANEDCDIRDNVIVKGRLEIDRYRQAVQQNNLIVAKDDARPAQTKSALLPNQYDPDRAHVVIYHWDKAETVEVDAGSFAKDGDVVELFDPKDPFGSPAATSTRRHGTIRVPVHDEFTVFLIKVRRS